MDDSDFILDDKVGCLTNRNRVPRLNHVFEFFFILVRVPRFAGLYFFLLKKYFRNLLLLTHQCHLNLVDRSLMVMPFQSSLPLHVQLLNEFLRSHQMGLFWFHLQFVEVRCL